MALPKTSFMPFFHLLFLMAGALIAARLSHPLRIVKLCTSDAMPDFQSIG